jgi:hypothetical protein
MGVAETVEVRELVISHSLVNSTSQKLYLTTTTTLSAYVYVGYQSKLPERQTVKDVL